MYDDLPKSTTAMQRARGLARVGLAEQSGQTRLRTLRQEGSAKAFLPKVHAPVPEVVFLNTAGGLTGGDRLDLSLDLGPGAQVVATTQTAERAYASAGGVGHMRATMTAGDGATLAWLPQETILFDRAALHRETDIALTGSAQLVFAEMVVLGRQAMRETVKTLDFLDRRRITRDGVPVMVEPLALTTRVLTRRDDSAVLGGATALATVALIGPGAETAKTSVTPLIEQTGVRAGLSSWDGKCVLRGLSHEPRALKNMVARVLAHWGYRPRVWNM
ncbi:MAG: urease accessory protein UreD [Pseudomonadota bacterium]